MQKVIIIGATSGIGRYLAIAYAKQNCLVGITGRRVELLEELKQLFPENFIVSSFDVTQNDNTLHIAKLVEQMGGLDVLIYNSGVGSVNPDFDSEIEMQTNAVNVAGFTACVIWAYNYFKQQKSGHLATISSVASIKGLCDCPSYSASKKYQVIYFQSLSQHSHKQKYNIRFTTILPGFVDTDFIKGSNYPLTVSLEKAGKLIFNAIRKKKRIAYIPFRWRLIVFIWKSIPNCIWERFF